MSSLHRIEPILTDACLECGGPVQYASYDGTPYAWRHVLSHDDHDPVPEHLSLRSITAAYEAERGA